METYYLNQAGTGLPLQIFAGTRYQRGNGFFGRFFMSKIMPILRYLGEQALSTGQAILSDTKKSAKDRVSATMDRITSDAIQKLSEKSTDTQNGSGLKSIKRKMIKGNVKRKTRKKIKSFKKSDFDFLK